MALSQDEVLHVARLARLRLSDDEVAAYREQLGRILEHMAELGALDTSSVPPTASVLGLNNVMRPDEALSCPSAADLLANAPAVEGPYVKVPKVIE